MPKTVLFLFLSLSALLATGCAGLQPRYEKPVVAITAFKAVPAQGAVPHFEIGLRIVNPNRQPLELKGVAYTISLEGYDLVTGVSNQLPVIEAYGEGHVTLKAAVDLFSSVGFITDLIRNQGRKQISYRFRAKLDIGTMVPLIEVTKKGEVSLAPSPADR